METLYALLELCEGNHWLPVDSPTKGPTIRWWFLPCLHEQAVEQRVELPVIWDATTLRWCHCNQSSNTKNLTGDMSCKYMQTLPEIIQHEKGRNNNVWFTISCWRHQTETFSALLAIYAGNSPVTGEFPAQKASDAELWCFLWSAPE